MVAAPVLLIAFNRPQFTAAVIAALRDAQVRQLFVSVDGPRDERDCPERDVVLGLVEGIDWPCDVRVRAPQANQGPGWGPRGAIDWFFENVGQGIILEDDTVPSEDALTFLSLMLDVHAPTSEVMSIAGTSLGASTYRGQESYFASRYATTWGWATWREAWQAYDWSMTDWPTVRASGWLRDVGGDRHFARHWTNVFDMAYSDRDHYWDYQWQYAVWREGGVAIHPRANLVTNIGFGFDATHTTEANARLERLAIGPLEWPLTAPASLEPVDAVDRWIDRHVYATRRSLRGRVYRRLTGQD